LFDNGQDNMTGLELDPFGADDLYFGTFDGPSFGSPFLSTIFGFNPASGPFEFGNLSVFALPLQMGLNDDDIIDALALSDIATLGSLNPTLDETLFSLAPGSITLAGLDGTFGTLDDLSAADIFYSNFDGLFSVFASHLQLGLLFEDNVDALDIRGVPEPSSLALVAISFLFIGGRRRRQRRKT
jgi:hypothetical protein